MAYLCKEEFSGSNNAGERIQFDCRVYATAAGEFVFYDIPKEVLGCLPAGLKYGKSKQGSHGLSVEWKAKGIELINKAITDYLKVETTEVLVIRYNYTATCHYFIGECGKLYQNGNQYEADTGKSYCTATWNKRVIDCADRSASMARSDDYNLGFRAQVEVKQTHVSGNNEDLVWIEYSRASVDDERLGTYGVQLNTFTRVSVFGEPIEIPYTEDAAKVFFESMWALCHMAYQLSEYLSEPQNILSGKQLLLGEGEDRQ